MFYSKKEEEVLSELGTSQNGLSSSEAAARIKKYGTNELQKEEKEPIILIFLHQFNDFLMYLLLFAAAISFFLGESLDAWAMLSISILTAILGFAQEYKASKAVEALKKMTAPHARVMRDGKEILIDAKDLVPGDIIVFEAGDIVPADCRLIEAFNLEIEEASLTGESVASKKNTNALIGEVQISDQHCMAFMTTPITYGKGKGIVVGTGMNTEIGKIAKSIATAGETMAPLQVKFRDMAKQIGYAVIALITIVFFMSLILRDPAGSAVSSVGHLMIFALSLAVAAIPNSLPAIVTISLAMGSKLLAKKNMIIKKLPATESLGSVTVICTDKTGTLTKNEMTVTKLFTNNKVIDVSGAGYAPEGNFSLNGKQLEAKGAELLMRIGFLCNNAKINFENGKYSIIGDPTEGSLITLGRKAKLEENFMQKFKIISELPFDSERKRMSVIANNLGNKKLEAYVKGAPDLMLEKCSRILANGKIKKLNPADRKNILKMNEAFASSALRVLAFAYKELPKEKPGKKQGENAFEIEKVEKDLVFVGLVGMIDPARDEVGDSIAKCKQAGIRVMMITGDHAMTAKAVAEKIGLYAEGDLVLTGAEIEKISDAELDDKIENIRIIARALPIQKLRIVKALQKKGHIVAMTGDGVNDAPALKKADIGIAMGITGTDVAKEVSEAMLVDDNFATIVNGVAEGRNIYDKIIKSTKYLLSCNAGEVVMVFSSIIWRLPLPILPLQILLMNLATDGLPALALTTEPGDSDIMQRPPRNPKDKPINRQMLFLIVMFGIIMGLGSLYLFWYSYKHTNNLPYAQTMAFTTLVMYEMFAVMGSRSFKPFDKINPLSNKWLLLAVISSVGLQIAVIYWAPLQGIFGTVALGGLDWVKILLLSGMGYIIMELSKFFLKSVKVIRTRI